MKKILFLIGLIGCTATASNAQDTKCTCVKKTAHHATHHRKVTTATAAVKHHHYTHKAAQGMAMASLPVSNRCAIDSNGEIQYMVDGSFTGNYPAGTPSCDNNELLTGRYKDLIITSPAFTNGGVLPAKYTCQGEQVNPPLAIGNLPDGTVSLAIILFDPHATAKKSTTYWLMWDIDPTAYIPENFTTDHESQNPVNKQYGYQAVCPISGNHNYHFRVYALDTKLLLNKRTNKASMENAMKGHILAKGEITGQYNRHLD